MTEHDKIKAVLDAADELRDLASALGRHSDVADKAIENYDEARAKLTG